MYTVKAADLKGIIEGVTGNLEVLVPVGITVTCMVIGAQLVPKLIKRLIRG